jgi:hypothetical protein
MNALHFENISPFFSAKDPVIGELGTDKIDYVAPKSDAVDDQDAKMATAAESEVDTTDDFRTNTINLFEVSEFSARLHYKRNSTHVSSFVEYKGSQLEGTPRTSS